MLALCQFVFWLTGQYEITDVIPSRVSSRSGSLHAMGAIILITVGYLQVPSDFVENLIDGLVSNAVRAPVTHTRLCDVILFTSE